MNSVTSLCNIKQIDTSFKTIFNFFPQVVMIVFAGIMKLMQEFYEKYKPRYIVYTGFTPRVYHSNPEHIKFIVNSTVHINKSDSFQVLSSWLDEGLVTSNGRCLHICCSIQKKHRSVRENILSNFMALPMFIMYYKFFFRIHRK